jgi:hypothetical protein
MGRLTNRPIVGKLDVNYYMLGGMRLMATKTSIGVPTASGVGKSLTNYGYGLAAGIGYNLVSGVTGSGLIGGAIAAAVTGAMVKGQAGELIATMAGFATGQRGLGSLGLGGGLAGGLAGLLGGGGGEKQAALDTI